MRERLIQRPPNEAATTKQLLRPLRDALGGRSIVEAAAEGESWICNRLQHVQNAINELQQALTTINTIPSIQCCTVDGELLTCVFKQQIEALDAMDTKIKKTLMAQEAELPESAWLPILATLSDEFGQICKDCIEIAFVNYGDFYGAHNE